MTIASILAFLWYIHTLIPTPNPLRLENLPEGDFSSWLYRAAWVLLYTLLCVPSLVLTLLSLLLSAAMFPLVWLFTKVLERLPSSKIPNRLIGVLRRLIRESRGKRDDHEWIPTKQETEGLIMQVVSWLFSMKRLMRFGDYRLEGALPFLIAVWCILAVELTLRWNAVQNVYDISNTGQIVPLVTGISGLLDTISKKDIVVEGFKPGKTTDEEPTHETSPAMTGFSASVANINTSVTEDGDTARRSESTLRRSPTNRRSSEYDVENLNGVFSVMEDRVPVAE